MTQSAATATPAGKAAAAGLLRGLEDVLPGLRDLYKDLHAHPELSFQEVRTAAVAAAWLREHGWEVTEGVGGTGVVGVLRGGLSPQLTVRWSCCGPTWTPCRSGRGPACPTPRRSGGHRGRRRGRSR